MEIKQLELEIKMHKNLYYNKQPAITDAQYDALEDQLRQIDPHNPILSKTGAEIDISPWEKAAHRIFLNSLNKVNTIEQFKDWYSKHNRLYVIQDKLDGISLELIYKSGKLVSAITRGDGLIGEDITRNVLRMKNVKPEIPYLKTLSLRAEIIILEEDFEPIQNQYSNMRNAASGIARRFDGTHSELLTVLYYYADFSVANHTDYMDRIAKMGLSTVPYQVYNTVEEGYAYYKDYLKKRPELNYDIDGLVIKINDIEYANQIDPENKNPKSQIAWKFPAYKLVAKIIDIEWSLKSGNTITPVAILEPIAVQMEDAIHPVKNDDDVRRYIGAKISRATLNNWDWMNNLGASVGDTVLVERANDVIPKIVKLLEKTSSSISECPACPVCGEEPAIIQKHYKCINPVCDAKALDDLIVYAKTHTKNVGPKLVESLYEAGMIKTPVDFYTISFSALTELEGIGDKKALLIVNSFPQNHKMTLTDYLLGLNIPMCLKSTVAKMIDKFENLGAMRIASYEQWLNVQDIGEITAQSLILTFSKKHNLIDQLLQYVEIEKEEEKSGTLVGKKFLITGTLSQPRKNYEQLIITNGGNLTSSVGSIDYLLCGENAGSKLAKAKKAGKTILSEDEFMAMI